MTTCLSCSRIAVLLALAVVSPAAAETGQPACAPIPGSSGLFAVGRVVLLGEMHGTEQSPAFAASVACNAVAADLNVIVGLELSASAQPSVNAYLRSTGTDDDRKRLVDHPLWQRDYQDGRTSQAMVELIDRVRQLRLAGNAIEIVMFDASGSRGGQQRERDMAAHLRKSIAGSPEAMHVVLTGNRHSRVFPGGHGNSEYEPMGYVLTKALGSERVVALDAGYLRGTAWVCNPDCGISTLGDHREGPPGSIEMEEETRPAGHRGWYFIGSITASPPASGGFLTNEHERAGQSGNAVSVAPVLSSARSTRQSEPSPAADDPATTPGASPERWQGRWQAWQYGSKAWTIRFEGPRFHAVFGPDDWYRGTILLRPEMDPAGIDFLIESCRCNLIGKTSKSIFAWDGDAVTLATPSPGSPRPTVFDEKSGQVVRLERMAE